MNGPSSICVGMPPDLYHAHPAICPDGLAQIARSALHYDWWRSRRLPDPEAACFHSALCILLFAPERFDACVEVRRDRLPVADSAESEIAPAQRGAGRRLSVAPSHYGALAAMARRIEHHPAMAALLEEKGRLEPVYLWTDAETGVACRARASWQCADGTLIRIVIAPSAHPQAFGDYAKAQREPVACAALAQGYTAITAAAPPRCLLIAVDAQPPYAVCLYEAGTEFLAQGRAQYRRELRLYAEALATGRWPGYGEDIRIL